MSIISLRLLNKIKFCSIFAFGIFIFTYCYFYQIYDNDMEIKKTRSDYSIRQSKDLDKLLAQDWRNELLNQQKNMKKSLETNNKIKNSQDTEETKLEETTPIQNHEYSQGDMKSVITKNPTTATIFSKKTLEKGVENNENKTENKADFKPNDAEIQTDLKREVHSLLKMVGN
jgi:hypothetical protein